MISLRVKKTNVFQILQTTQDLSKTVYKTQVYIKHVSFKLARQLKLTFLRWLLTHLLLQF